MSLLALGNPRPWTQAKEVWEEAPMWYLDTPQGWSWGSQALESQPLCIANHPPPTGSILGQAQAKPHLELSMTGRAG